MTDPGRGYRTIVASIWPIILVSFQRWVGADAKPGGALYAITSLSMMNGAICWRWAVLVGWHRADALLHWDRHLFYSALRMRI